MYRIMKQLFLGGLPIIIRKCKTKKEAKKIVERLDKQSDIFTIYSIVKGGE